MRGEVADTIATWVKGRDLDDVVWTHLQCGFKTGRGRMPSDEDLIKHMQSLDVEVLEKAKDYFRSAPVEVDTAYKRRITAHFGWA